MADYQAPTKGDLERHISAVAHEARAKAGAEGAKLLSEAAKHGAVGSSRVAVSIAQAIDKVQTDALERAAYVMKDFVERMHVEPSEITKWAKPHLESMNGTLSGSIPFAGTQKVSDDNRARYDALFSKRLDGCLRDLEIGFVGGRSIVSEAEKSQSKALRLLKLIYDKTQHNENPAFAAQLGESIGLSQAEAEASWRYLRDRNLIEVFNLPYTARINAAGIDAIEDAESHPDRPPQAFPATTYNHIYIGTAVNSPVMQGGASSVQSQTISYSGATRADLDRLVTELKAHLPELQLESDAFRKAKAQLGTLEAQLEDEAPDPVIVQQAGKTLRNVTEGVIAGLAATAIHDSAWPWIHAALLRLFA